VAWHADTSVSRSQCLSRESTREKGNSLPSLLLGASYHGGKVQQGWNKLGNISKSLSRKAHPVEQHLHLDLSSRKAFTSQRSRLEISSCKLGIV